MTNTKYSSFISEKITSFEQQNKYTKQLVYLARYGLSSGISVVVDFTLFYFFVNDFKIEPFLANILSMTIAIVSTWTFSGKVIFKQHKISFKNYIYWFSYLALVLPIYSFILQTTITIGINIYIAKILVLCISFFTNSFVLKKFILK